jgi:hypothetical protein
MKKNANPAIVPVRPRCGVLVRGCFGVAFCATLIVVSWSAPAGAQTRDPVAAEVLFQEGRRLMKDGRFQDAVDKLTESLRLDPAVGTLANLAGCQEELGRTASAWQHWRQAADQMSSRDPRRKQALARAAQLEKVLPRLQIDVPPESVVEISVDRDGVTLGQASFGLALAVDPGHHVVRVWAPEREPRRWDLVVAEGETRVLAVEPGPALPPPAPAAPSRGPQAGPPAWGGSEPVRPVAPPTAAPVSAAGMAPASPAASPRTAGSPQVLFDPFSGVARQQTGPWLSRLQRRDWILVGVGLGGLGAAGWFGLQALRARDQAGALCSQQTGLTRCWSGAQQPLARDRRSSLLADVGLVAGTTAAATAAFLLTRPRPGAPAVARLLAAPVRGGGEVRVAGSF